MKTKLCLLLLFCGMSFGAFAQGFNPVLAANLQNTIYSMRLVQNVRGISACVFYPGVGTWKGVSGISHPGSLMNSELEFGIASNTKLFTGVMVLQCADNGLLTLDDSLHEHLPPFNNIDSNITIRQLLNHTSGLYDVTSVPGYPDSIFTDPNRIFTPSEMISWAGPPVFAAGTGWEYCNTNYILAGMIAESVTGISYSQLLRDSILSPLQLDSTFLDVYDSILYPVAHPWQAGVDNYPVSRTALNSAAGAAGAMYSTCGEMVQWYQALMSGQVLSPASFQELTTFVGTGNYGIGISEVIVQGRTVWTHGGNIWGGYNSNMMVDVATGAIICVLINQTPAQSNQISIQLLSTLMNTTGVEAEQSPDHSAVIITPNPVTDFIRVQCPGQQIRRLQLLTAAGEILDASDENHFNMERFPAGLYVVLVETDSGLYRRKIVKW
ncbi:MAG: serine hydrolase [Bacteroidota bacterium]